MVNYLGKRETRTLIKLLQMVPGQQLEIENEPYMPLTIKKQCKYEPTPDYKDTDWQLVYLAHYGKQNGEPMSDTEMDFLVSIEQEHAKPLILTKHCEGIRYHGCRRDKNGWVINWNPKSVTALSKIADEWLQDIEQQGFLEKG